MEKFTLINKDRSRIKVFEASEDISKPGLTIYWMKVSYGCVYKRSSKAVMKGSILKTIESSWREYKKLIEQECEKTQFLILILVIAGDAVWNVMQCTANDRLEIT